MGDDHIPEILDESEFPGRLRRLIAVEIDRIVEDLEVRREFLMLLWTRHRDRGPFLDTVFNRYKTLSMPDLAVLPIEAVVTIECFYRELEELKFYFAYTQDMPATMADRYDSALLRVATYGAKALDVLGGAPERPIVDFDDPPGSLLAALPPPPSRDPE